MTRPRPKHSRGLHDIVLERELAAAVGDYLRHALRPPTIWTVFPAGGGGLERGRMLARLGLRPGWPDVQVMHPVPASASCLLVGLELKTPIGRQSLVQKQVEADFAAAGAVYRLCRSIDDVERVLRMVGVPVYAHARAA